jgi:hypothetical protein
MASITRFVSLGFLTWIQTTPVCLAGWSFPSIIGANNNSLPGCTIHTDPFVFYNVISGNGANGLLVDNSNGTTIQAKFFGMEADNNTALGNGTNGVIKARPQTPTWAAHSARQRRRVQRAKRHRGGQHGQ